MLAIALLIALQALWFILPRQGSTLGVSYRNSDRIAALKEYAEGPSVPTRQAVERELSLLSEHMARRQRMILLTFLITDAVLICVCWSFWNRRYPLRLRNSPNC